MKVITENLIKTDKYFSTTKYVPAVKSNPMPNCTTFCMCFLHWIMNATKSMSFISGRSAAGFGNAKTWWDTWMFEKGQEPKISSIAVWDGNYGHVAVVYDYRDLGNGSYEIDTYESYYQKFMFRKHTYTVKKGVTNPKEGLGKFKGFCYHPYYKEDKPQPTPTPTPTPTPDEFVVGKVYKLKFILKVRVGAGTTYKQKTYLQLTTNARKNAYMIGKNAGCLKEGTEVTCQEIKKNGNQIWIRIPSGWICGKEGNTKYIVNK